MAEIVLVAVSVATTALSAGEMIAQLLKKKPVPQLQSLNVSSSAEGSPIPIGYGTTRSAGSIIWSPGLTYVQINDAPGKGSPKGYAYYLSFAAAFGEGPGFIHRIWADSKLIYLASGLTPNMSSIGTYAAWSSTANYQPGDLVLYLTPGATGVGSQLVWQCLYPNTNQPPSTSSIYWELASDYPPWDDNTTYQIGAIVGYFTQVYAAIQPSQGVHPGSDNATWLPLQSYFKPPAIYIGSDVQGADPTIQEDLGIANTQAFRGLCYAVWKNMPLANFGNRLPNIRAEIYWTRTNNLL